MPLRCSRRAALAGSLLAISCLSGQTNTSHAIETAERFADLESRAAGRLGIAMLDTGDGTRRPHRADERFPMCSTFKVLAAALVLTQVERGEEDLARRIVITQEELVPFSPVTALHTGGEGMTLADLCAAAITRSDNTAGNLLLASFGGPPALTAYARSLDDEVTRLDRMEPELNEATPGDPRDTTSPAAMLATLRQLTLGDALSGDSRERLTGWLLANTTGDARLRAGLPADWQIGDKTGSGMNGTTNDIAVIWPPDRAPIILAAYLTESTAPPDERDGVMAEIARIIAAGD